MQQLVQYHIRICERLTAYKRTLSGNVGAAQMLLDGFEEARAVAGAVFGVVFFLVVGEEGGYEECAPCWFCVS